MKIIEKVDEPNDILIKDKENNILSLFYFTASWCNPCKKIYPSLLKLEEELKKQSNSESDNESDNKSDSKFREIIFYKIDIDENEEYVDTLNIEKVPTFYLYDGIELLDSTTGSNIQNIGELIKKYI